MSGPRQGLARADWHRFGVLPSSGAFEGEGRAGGDTRSLADRRSRTWLNLATKSGKKCWEFRLLSVTIPAFALVYEECLADTISASRDLAPHLTRMFGGKSQKIG